jgi:hypothetical protein
MFISFSFGTKMKVLFLLLSAFFCNVTFGQNISSAPKLNIFERALDFETGNVSLYNEWVDDGALHQLSDWYNISIIMVDSPQYAKNGGPLTFVGLVPLPGTSINKMKAALGKACGIAPEAWDREQLRERTTLKAKGLKCQARFDNWFRGEGVWNMIIQKNE